MKYLKYAFYSIVSKPIFNFVIMLELAAVLAAGNMIISVVNSRSVYYEPYAELMSHEGYVFTPQNLNSYSEDMEQKKFYNSLQGDIDVTYAYVRQLMTSSDILKNDMYDEEIKYRNLICGSCHEQGKTPESRRCNTFRTSRCKTGYKRYHFG